MHHDIVGVFPAYGGGDLANDDSQAIIERSMQYRWVVLCGVNPVEYRAPSLLWNESDSFGSTNKQDAQDDRHYNLPGATRPSHHGAGSCYDSLSSTTLSTHDVN